MISVRHSITLALCYATVTAPVLPQEIGIEPVKRQAPIFKRPYMPVEVPPVRLVNSNRITELLRAGKLYLTAQDAIEIALENNIDIEVARYNKAASEWQLERFQAGGALAGVPSSAAQAFSVAAGQGVQ